jgi:hypothetical protein
LIEKGEIKPAGSTVGTPKQTYTPTNTQTTTTTTTTTTTSNPPTTLTAHYPVPSLDSQPSSML